MKKIFKKNELKNQKNGKLGNLILFFALCGISFGFFGCKETSLVFVEGTTIVRELLEYLATDKGIRKTPKTFSELYYNEDFVKHQPKLIFAPDIVNLPEICTLLDADFTEGIENNPVADRFVALNVNGDDYA